VAAKRAAVALPADATSEEQAFAEALAEMPEFSEQEHAAALKIQSLQRGRLARKKVAAKREERVNRFTGKVMEDPKEEDTTDRIQVGLRAETLVAEPEVEVAEGAAEETPAAEQGEEPAVEQGEEPAALEPES